jgi:hypothetical protein
LFQESKESELRESNSKYHNLMRDYVNNQSQLILSRIELNNQIKHSKKDNELLVQQKEQLEKYLKGLKGHSISLLLRII